MKKIVLLAAAALVSTGAFAQNFEKGDITLSGRFSGLDVAITDWDGTSETDIDFGVAGGYFFMDKLAADVELGLNYKKVQDVDATNAITFGVGVRYYFYDNLYARLGYEGNKVKGVDEMESYVGLSVGYDYFISEKVFFEPALYFKKGMGDYDKVNKFGLTLGVGVKF